jgi:hypothetical protein
VNWLTKKVADEKTFYAVFLTALFIYGVIACFITAIVGSYFPTVVGKVIFCLLGGTFFVAYVARVAHNLAYAKVNNDNK